MAIRGKTMPKAKSLTTRQFNKVVTTERKFNTAIKALRNSTPWSRTERLAEGQLKRLTPYKDAVKLVRMWWDYHKAYNKANRIWSRLKTK